MQEGYTLEEMIASIEAGDEVKLVFFSKKEAKQFANKLLARTYKFRRQCQEVMKTEFFPISCRYVEIDYNAVALFIKLNKQPTQKFVAIIIKV